VSETGATGQQSVEKSTWLPGAAAIVALIGVLDSVYLTVHHYTAEPVPCSIIEGCEQVLTSSWAEIGGIPLAGFGAAAYFLAFSLAVMTAYGSRGLWRFYGIQATIMACFSGYLIYVQGALIGAFCQFCLISAATSLTLFIIFLVSVFKKRRSSTASV
jgi:uncharacterized membrane protein